MANTSSRTLRLLSLLQTRRYWPGGALADRLGVSVRTLRRDIDRLRELGYPVDAQRGVDGGYQLAAGAALPPLVVDDEEAVALAVGMQAAVNGAVAGIEESAVRALTKVVQVMPPRLRRRVDALRAVTVPAVWSAGPEPAPAVDPEVLIAVAQACRDTERLRFDYTGAGRRADPPARRAAPAGPARSALVPGGLRPGPARLAQLPVGPAHRARGAPGPGSGTRALPTADAAEFVRAGVRRARSLIEVEVLVHAPAARVRDQVGRWADGGGARRAALPAADVGRLAGLAAAGPRCAGCRVPGALAGRS